jgi:hypothetical protein
VSADERASISLRHPAYLGGVELNGVTIREQDSEIMDSLPPGTLADQAVLLRFDPEAVCIGLRLRTRSEDAGLADLRRWRPVLVVDDRGTIDFPSVQPYRVIRRRYDRSTGADTRHPEEDFAGAFAAEAAATNGTTNAISLGGALEDADHDPWQPVSYAIGGGVVCFEHHGAVGPATARIALRLEPAAGVDAEPREFGWRFVFPPPGTPIAVRPAVGDPPPTLPPPAPTPIRAPPPAPARRRRH